MKDNNQKARLEGLVTRVREQSTEPPLHMVVPVESTQVHSVDSGSESQLNVQIKTEIIDQLKIHSIRTKKSLKLLVAEALSQFLDNVEKKA